MSVKPRPSLQNSGHFVKIVTNDPITNVVPYRPERPPKWMFWKTQKEYLAVVTKSQKLYICDFTDLNTPQVLESEEVEQ
jgi:hypothetical protein